MIGLLVVLLSVGNVAAEAPEETVPRAVLERFVSTAVHDVRVSLFDNRVAVVSVSQNGKTVLFRKTRLPITEYRIYLQATERDAALIDAERSSNPVRSASSAAKIFVSTEPGRVFEVSFSPLAVLELPLARLNALVDDLQQRVVQSHPYEEQLFAWKPTPGDRVEFKNGQLATLVEVRVGGDLVFRHDRTNVLEIVPAASMMDVLLRVLEE